MSDATTSPTGHELTTPATVALLVQRPITESAQFTLAFRCGQTLIRGYFSHDLSGSQVIGTKPTDIERAS
jgi:hypothetical protein